MNLLELLQSMGKSTSARIGIGLGDEESHNLKILNASIEFIKLNPSTIFIFGTAPSIIQVSNALKNWKIKFSISFVQSEQPEKEILKWLKEGKIDAVVRGCLSSTTFLEQVKKEFKTTVINRLALLETFDNAQFFYGPVGIDECNTVEKKVLFIKQVLKIFHALSIAPKVSVLSGGRKTDIGRDPVVDLTIKIALDVVERLKLELPNLDIGHDEILIENSISRKANLIIAPEGISGNLIYRTLVHLGGGNAYGAIYMDLDKPIIDTSRVGNSTEIQGAFWLAVAMMRCHINKD